MPATSRSGENFARRSSMGRDGSPSKSRMMKSCPPAAPVPDDSRRAPGSERSRREPVELIQPGPHAASEAQHPTGLLDQLVGEPGNRALEEIERLDGPAPDREGEAGPVVGRHHGGRERGVVGWRGECQVHLGGPAAQGRGGVVGDASSSSNSGESGSSPGPGDQGARRRGRAGSGPARCSGSALPGTSASRRLDWAPGAGAGRVWRTAPRPG